MHEKIGLLHPGQMGVSIGAAALNAGHEIFWVPEGRSAETRKRAESQGFIPLDSLIVLGRTCSVIISVCPPHAAEGVASEVVKTDFKGIYLDANAISPERAIRIGEKMLARGIAFVDGGIIGGPSWVPGTTWLYLSGEGAEKMATCFSKGPLETQVLAGGWGKASALKMCYAAFTKGSTALLCAILAAAESLGIRQVLEQQWSQGGSDFALQTHRRVQGVTSRAWRFAGEMEEIAATLEDEGIPGGFHESAAQIYRRIAHFKGLSEPPTLEVVLAALLVQPEHTNLQKPNS